MARTVRDEITYPCPHSQGCIVEVLVLINNLIPHFIIGVICYPCWDLSSFLLVNGGPWEFGIGIRLVKQYMDFQKDASEMSQIYLGLSDDLYRSYVTDTIQRYFNCETDKCLMHLKIWPWSVSQVFSVSISWTWMELSINTLYGVL